ncbi:DUF1574 family protein [Singulisphaera sp. PoT]|uniref:DUF1574 family protein n=1 Tax=Singulisphaera sp. PoT TaxID=3411797 RepID=UPI003BF5F07E
MLAKRRTSGRARAALAWGLLWFVAAQLASGFLLRARPELTDREFGRKVADLRRLRDQNPGRPLVLMLGSSRVATGFRPTSFRHSGIHEPLVYNFAQVGTGPEMAHLSLTRLLEAGIRPDWVFVEFWAPNWNTERTLRDFGEQINLAGLHWSDVQLLAGYVKESRRSTLKRQWLAQQIAPLYTNRSMILEALAPRWIVPAREPDHRCQNLDDLGWWSPRKTITPKERAELSERYELHYEKRLRDYRTRSNPDRALRAMLMLCRVEKIKASVIVLPEAEAFRQIYPAGTTEQIQAYLDTIRREFSIDVVDARDWVEADGFMDGHHLMPSGAQVFSQRLEAEVLHPRLAEIPRPSRR